eukprot:m51a1_g6580 Vacuolar protein sorting 26 (348) ;mRNA; r:209091-211318
MSFLFGSPCTVDVTLADAETRSKVVVNQEKGKSEELYRFIGNEDVKGAVTIKLSTKGKRFEHSGIKIEFIGQIELFYDRGNHYDFTSLLYELVPAGAMTQDTLTLPFEFINAEKQYESYNGINVRLRYFLRATVARGLMPNITKELDLWVVNFQRPPEMNNSIKMEVGIEDCLHIEFEYNKSKYHLKDVVIGKVFFLLVRIRIKYMEICLLKKESTGQPPNVYNETETLTKYEIMDGAPVKGESLPVRLFLGHFDLTPTYRNVHNKFSVKYFLNLVLVDEEDRRYFKQQEVTLWRRPQKKVAGAASTDPAAPDPMGLKPRFVAEDAVHKDGERVDPEDGKAAEKEKN